MSETVELGGDDGGEPSFRQRLRSALEATGSLLSTRAEIFREEASQKAAYLTRGLGGIFLALVIGWIAMLLLAALACALFALLFGRVWAGILAALVLYGGACAAAAYFGVKALSKVRPFDFPVTKSEARKDWEMLWDRICPDEEISTGPEMPSPRPSESVGADDVEARFRAGSE
jgi:Putative Actinobacterial Holin-X, holin superfamily III